MTLYRKHIDDWLAGRVEGARVATLVGLRLAAFAEGVVTMEMDAGPRHHNPMGTVHGGVFCDLADLAMGTAVAATLEEGEGFTTVQLVASYLRPVTEGLLTATARVTHRGRSVGHAEAEIVDGEGRAVARFTSVCMVLRRS